jgi:pyrrolidone-carboxylate peptidase
MLEHVILFGWIRIFVSQIIVFNFLFNYLFFFFHTTETIDPACPLGEAVGTALPLDQVKEELVGRGFRETIVSTDPGRYICNYIYYKSLCRAWKSGGKVHSLFVHFPSEATVPIERQKEFAWNLLDALSAAVITA